MTGTTAPFATQSIDAGNSFNDRVRFTEAEAPSLEDVSKISIPTSLLLSNNDSAGNSASLSSPSSSSPLFLAYWYKVEKLLNSGWLYAVDSLENKKNVLYQEMHTHRERGFVFSTLHGAAYLSESLPPVLTDLIIRCHAHMINNKTIRDGGGLLPLHLAVTVVDIEDDHRKHHLLPHSNDCALRIRQANHRKHFIKQLLKADPTTAYCKIPGTNRLPFVQAIVSGLHWHIKSNEQADDLLLSSSSQTFYCNGVEHSWNNNVDAGCQGGQARSLMEVGPLQILWKYTPDALCIQDPVTGLYPFMLAAMATKMATASIHNDHGIMETKTPIALATKIFRRNSHRMNSEKTLKNENERDDNASNETNSSEDHEDDVMQLDTVYSLLRLFPQAVRIL